MKLSVKSNLSLNILLVFILFTVFLSIHSYFNYVKVVSGFKEQNHNYIESILKIIENQISSNDLATIKLSKTTENSEIYLKNIKVLRKIHDPIKDKIKYMYTSYKVNEKIFFGIDAALYEDADKDGVIDHSYLHQEYEDAPAQLFEAYESKKIVFSKDPYTDKWGTFLSAFYPIKNEKGEVISVIAVDQTVSQYNSYLEILTSKMFFNFIIMECLLGIVCLIFWFFIKKNIEFKKQEEIIVNASKMIDMGLLTAMITHEINNPLSVIVYSLSLIKRRSVLDENGLKYIKNIETNAARIEATVKQVKNFVRNNDGENKHFLITDVLNNSLEFINPKIKNINLIKNFNTDSKVSGDSGQLSQVLINLISNAADAIEKETDPWIKLNCYEKESSVYVEVINSGPKLSKEMWEKISKGFYSTKEKGKGSGMGILIVQKILSVHQSKLEVDFSEPHTKFKFKIPIVK